MKFDTLSEPDFKKAIKRNKSKTIALKIQINKDLKNQLSGKYYFIKTHGCQANYRDSETFKGYFELLGMKETLDVKKAYIALINSCAVRQKAEEKVLSEFGQIRKLKLANKIRYLILSGCMAEETKNIKLIKQSFNYVDLVLGTHDINNFLNDLEGVVLKNKKIIDVSSSSGCIYENQPSKRFSQYKAFVNITYGCDKFCSYCIVPYLRGRQRSRQFNDIIKECKDLEKQGYKEITLLGQNVTSYGKDIDGNSYTFANLLDKVADLNIPRINFLTSHPYDFDDDIIKVIKKHKNIMRFIHLPVQSCSDSVLRQMNRKYTISQYIDLIKKIRKGIPEIRISTDLIVGYPSETEDNFKDSINNLDKIKFDSAFTFIYSPREGTPSAKLTETITKQEKIKRFKLQQKILNKHFSESNSKYINKVLSVLVDSQSKNNPKVLSGYSHENLLINFEGNKNLIGKIVNVKIISEHIFFLKGKLLQ